MLILHRLDEEVNIDVDEVIKVEGEEIEGDWQLQSRYKTIRKKQLGKDKK